MGAHGLRPVDSVITSQNISELVEAAIMRCPRISLPLERTAG